MDADSSLYAERTWKTPLQLLTGDTTVKICAPMVRYSKLPFRQLVRKYQCDLAFTPMIISDSFIRSVKARDSEFTTCAEDRPLIVQFAANNPQDLANAAEIISPFSDGIDLNCGCPQRWAMAEGYGACLIDKPQLLYDIVHETKSRIQNPDFTVSVKMRIHSDIRTTVDLCQKLEKTGVSWITVHGRTKDQHHQPANVDAIRLIKENVNIPVVANGDIKSLDDVTRVAKETGVNGVMSARGILGNPAMFAGYNITPLQCVQDWLDISLPLGMPFPLFHHHLIDMLEKSLCRSERRVFNTLSSTSSVIDYLRENFQIGT
ncbi:tRNA-dihydrouridine(20a/20b) synthase [NAD(P)+]-like [Gigantopelta aegis]|uniref:tRNA-dihydrouridine(20a/20b) synthase [NAD(P)+]-like n=1 Tax=Gigantopelta aegis TaxID=1735272 RepID=UPI001B88C129|nr:tRNA-dihydrouridine(20a/20b) synthase [NAD(P)+]-like [Gigantopelta aegis]